MAFSKSLEQGRCPDTHFWGLFQAAKRPVSLAIGPLSNPLRGFMDGWSLNWPLGPVGGTLGMR